MIWLIDHTKPVHEDYAAYVNIVAEKPYDKTDISIIEKAQVFAWIREELDKNGNHWNRACRDAVRRRIDGKYSTGRHRIYHYYNTWLAVADQIAPPEITIDRDVDIPVNASCYVDSVPGTDDIVEVLSAYEPIIVAFRRWAAEGWSTMDDKMGRFVCAFAIIVSHPKSVQNLLAVLWNLEWAHVHLDDPMQHIAYRLQAARASHSGVWHTLPFDGLMAEFFAHIRPAKNPPKYVFRSAIADKTIHRAYVNAIKKRAKDLGFANVSLKKLEGVGQTCYSTQYYMPCAIRTRQNTTTCTSRDSLDKFLNGEATGAYGDARQTEATELTDAEVLRMGVKEAKQTAIESCPEAKTAYPLFTSFIHDMSSGVHKASNRARSEMKHGLIERITGLSKAEPFSLNQPVPDMLMSMMRWGTDRVSEDMAPHTQAKKVQTVHNWIVGRVGNRRFCDLSQGEWTRLIADFNAGYRHDRRHEPMDYLEFLQAGGDIHVDLRAIYRDSFVSRPFDVEPHELVGASETAAIFHCLDDTQRLYFSLGDGTLRGEECHLLTRRCIIVTPDEHIEVCVKRSKSPAGKRTLAMRLLMPPMVYEWFRAWTLEFMRTTKNYPGMPFIPRSPGCAGIPDALKSFEVHRELESIFSRIRAILKLKTGRNVSFHDLRRGVGNCLVLRLFELALDMELQPAAYRPAMAPWCPVPAATAHELIDAWSTREQLVGRPETAGAVWGTVAQTMGHVDMSSTSSVYFQGFLPLDIAFMEFLRKTGVFFPWLIDHRNK